MNSDILQKTYRKLIFEVSHNFFSFCIQNTISNKIEAFSKSTISNKGIIDEEIWKIFIQNPLLNASFDQISVLHSTSMTNFVPSAFFDPNYLGSYLQYNNKVFETDYFAFDYLDNYDLNNVFIPYTEINNYLLEHYDSFDYKNSGSILVKKILDLSKYNDQKQVWVHFQEQQFEIIVVRNQQLILYNTFKYKTLEDFIYYLLFTFEQLQLNPEIVQLHFVGDISLDSDYFKIAYKYIRNCSIYDVVSIANSYSVSTKDMLHHFILFQS